MRENGFRMQISKTDTLFVPRTHTFLDAQFFLEDGTENARFAPTNYTGNSNLKKTQRLLSDLRRQTYLRPIKMSFNDKFKTSSCRWRITL